MGDLQLFDVQGRGWRFGQDADGTPWAVATDVAKSFGYRNANDALRNLDDQDGEKGTRIVRTPGGEQRVGVVFEDGLWELIFISRRPEAKAIKSRVKAILREIRETGSYSTGPRFAVPQSFAEALELAARQARELDAARGKVAELEPEAARARHTIDSNGMSLVGTVAKRFGIRERSLREFLYAEKLLIRGGARHNEPYANFVQSGHFEVKVRTVETNPDRPPEAKSTTFVTPKGEALIWKRLYAAGLVSSPTMPCEQLVFAGGA